MEIDKRNRSELKSYFVKNAIPTQENFADLIDAMLSQRDDGIVKRSGNPLSIEAAGDDTSQKKALHLYESFTDASPAWVISLKPRQDVGAPATARAGFSIGDSAGQSRLFIDRTTGNIGVGTVTPAAKLQVSGGAIMPHPGNSKDAGIYFPENPFGGGGDAAWIRYYPRSGEATTFEIGNSNDKNDHIALMASGNVGVGTNNPSHKLHVLAHNAVGLFESTGPQAYLKLSTREGLKNRVELANRPGGELALWTAGSGDALRIARDGKVSINGGNAGFQLTVTQADNHLQLRREPTNKGGKCLFLDLYQHNPHKNTPDVYPSIRFHHNNRYWHRLEARNNGFHFKDGNLSQDDYRDVFVKRCRQRSSRDAKEDISALEASDAVAALQALVPVRFRYRDEPGEGRVLGFIAEDVPDLVASADRKHLNALEIVALLARVVKEHEHAIRRLLD